MRSFWLSTGGGAVPSMGSVLGSWLFPFWSGVTDDAGCVGGSMDEDAFSVVDDEEPFVVESGL